MFMFRFLRKTEASGRRVVEAAVRPVRMSLMEGLEERQLLSASLHHGRGGGGFGGFGGHSGGGGQVTTVLFSQTSSTVQAGLDNLATTDGLSDPTADQTVYLGNRNGVETYSVVFNTTGTVSRITVDQNGNAVDAPNVSTTSFGTLSGSGTGSDAAAAGEITSIASALNLTAPGTDTAVTVASVNGTTTYSVELAPAAGAGSSDTTFRAHGVRITVDAAGNPAGNQNLPFGVMPTAIQNALNANAPSGATALTADSTVRVRTVDGVATYSATFSASGTQTTVTVNAAGQLTSLPSHTTTTFGALSTAVQTELQTLATGNGVSTTIATGQSVDVLTESNGSVIYSVSLPATTAAGDSGRTFTRTLTISVDAAGNPTVLPGGDGRGFGDGFRFGGDDGGDFGGGGGGSGGDCAGGGGTSSSGTSTTTGSTGSGTTATAVLSGTRSITASTQTATTVAATVKAGSKTPSSSKHKSTAKSGKKKSKKK